MPNTKNANSVYTENVVACLDNQQDKDLAVRFMSFFGDQKGVRHDPAGFCSWMQFLLKTAHFSFRTDPNFSVKDPRTYANCRPRLVDESKLIMSSLCDHAFPPRYASREISLAWQKTKVPKLNWNNPYVLPGYVIFPPCPVKEMPPDYFAGRWFIESLMIIHQPAGLMLFANSITYKPETGFFQVEPASFFVEPDVDYNDSNFHPEVRAMALMAINSWLVHAYERELIEQEPVRMHGGFGVKQASRSPIAPTWIGRNFKIRRESSLAAGQETGIKVRPHWRSGHWHTVRHGKGREQERLQWYRPTYVNADS